MFTQCVLQALHRHRLLRCEILSVEWLRCLALAPDTVRREPPRRPRTHSPRWRLPPVLFAVCGDNIAVKIISCMYCLCDCVARACFQWVVPLSGRTPCVGLGSHPQSQGQSLGGQLSRMISCPLLPIPLSNDICVSLHGDGAEVRVVDESRPCGCGPWRPQAFIR